MSKPINELAVGINSYVAAVRIGDENKTPSSYDSADLAERAIQRRAIEAAIWGMPTVNYHLMYQEMVNKVKGGFNQVLILVSTA